MALSSLSSRAQLILIVVGVLVLAGGLVVLGLGIHYENSTMIVIGTPFGLLTGALLFTARVYRTLKKHGH